MTRHEIGLAPIDDHMLVECLHGCGPLTVVLIQDAREVAREHLMAIHQQEIA